MLDADEGRIMGSSPAVIFGAEMGDTAGESSLGDDNEFGLACWELGDKKGVDPCLVGGVGETDLDGARD